MRKIAEDYAKAVLREQYESHVSQDNSFHWPIRAWAINEAYNDPVFYRWLFDDDSIDDFGTNLSDEERKTASNFFKSL